MKNVTSSDVVFFYGLLAYACLLLFCAWLAHLDQKNPRLSLIVQKSLAFILAGIAIMLFVIEFPFHQAHALLVSQKTIHFFCSSVILIGFGTLAILTCITKSKSLNSVGWIALTIFGGYGLADSCRLEMHTETQSTAPYIVAAIISVILRIFIFFMNKTDTKKEASHEQND
jgi:hypothetical protein